MIKSKWLLAVFTILFLGVFSISYAQEIDTLEIEGEEFFVYPFEVKVSAHSQYFNVQKNTFLYDNLTYDLYQELAMEETGEEVSKKDFKKLKREIRKFQSSFGREMFDRKEEKYLSSRKFLKAIRKNPYPLLQQRFQPNSDLTPMLDPIPDGKYVQLYEEFCLINEKGNCEETTNRVAGYFTMKNNLLEGEATWIDLHGDTLKHGWFVNGIKEGEWKFEQRDLEYDISEYQVERYIDRGFPNIDTLTEYITYERGAKKGKYRKYLNSEYPIEEGYYTNGSPTGTWITRDIIYSGYGDLRKRIRNNELVTSKLSYEPNDTLVVHPRWIRNGIVGFYGVNREQFSFYSKYSLIDLPELYEIAHKKEENLELEEELEGAPYDLDFYEDEYYEEELSYNSYYQGKFGYDEYTAISFDQNTQKFFPRGHLMDSIGARPNYNGVYEARYENGQLAYKYVFENGLLIEEDTLFWDNGNAHDVITEVPDSNQFLRSIYDYNGKIYLELAYDSLGDFIRIQKNYEVEETFLIDGYEVTGGGYGMFYFYDIYDTLDNEAMVDPTLLFRSWSVDDSTVLYSSTYYPEEKQYSLKAYSVLGSEMMNDEKSFSDDFESWTGKKVRRVGEIELEKTSSGALYENYEPDSIPIRHIREDDLFNVASEFKLKKNGQAYTGPVELNFGQKKLKFSKNDLTIALPSSKYTSKKLNKDLKRYRKTGKTKYPIIMNFIDPTELGEDLSENIFNNFFLAPLGGFFAADGDNYSDDYYYEDNSDPRLKIENAVAIISKIEGFMVDGKPNGLWIGFDQFGKKMIEVTYSKGEANGEVIWYNYADPIEENEYSWMDYDYDNPLRDSFPEKREHYVEMVANYQNGKAHGKQYFYSWYGEMTEESNYEDGFMDGLSIERNKLATTEANYKFGQANGYVKTYLTLNPGDSILLYNLNFQDGLLQGESKAFHTNGKLAKRGFFLDGRPIEDYEAYDSLGFKYHYVKFQYSFPVEEKIWEENELSVRYLFDWQDSIHFEPSDITTSQSLESIISKLGLGGSYFERPYYGRRSLVNKNNIDYHMTKYYPNDTVSRDGDLSDGQKTGCWNYFSYNGELLYQVDYQDSIIQINDSIKFKSKGVLTDFDSDGNPIYESFVIEMSSKYDCAHSDHYEIRQLYTKWEVNDSLGRMNGSVQNFYDNGTLQSEGLMKNGLPDGVWKYYDPYGKLNQYGVYVLGKRNARWLSGDLSKTKYLGDICLNPNLPELDKEIKYRENLLDIKITNYDMGKSLNTQYYDIDMNRFIDDEENEEIDED